MQPPGAPPRVRFTSSALATLRAEVRNNRELLVRILTAIQYHLPREAAGRLDAVVPGYPNCFLWEYVFVQGGVVVRVDCIVSRAGWPDNLWLVDFFVS